MIKKSLLIVFCYLIFGVIFSCECSHVKYYDFNEAEIYLYGNNLNESDSLFFRIDPIDMYFLADNFKKTQLFGTAYALKCDKGYGGMKYEVIKIEITSDSDFNDQFLTNTLLNDLVTVKTWTNSNNFDHIKLNDADLSKIIWSELYIAAHPTISREHIFTIKLYKSDGDVISFNSEKIFWQ